jgi:hypothetical protein
MVGRNLMAALFMTSVATTASAQVKKEESYAAITWRIQNQTKDQTIVEYEVVFTAKDGRQQVIPKTGVSIGPGSDYDVRTLDGPCIVKIEGAVRFAEKVTPGSTSTRSQKMSEHRENCIKGVEYMRLDDKK